MFGGIGCLPLLIQMPFFTALFYAARYTEGIADATFLGMNLGSPSLVFTAIAGVLYFGQSWMMQIGIDEEQKKQMRTMMLMNPIMIVMLSWGSPAGVTLYWVISGLVGLIQQAVTNLLLKGTTGMNKRQLVAHRGGFNGIDSLTSQELIKYQALEDMAIAMINLGMRYQDIKSMVFRPRENAPQGA